MKISYGCIFTCVDMQLLPEHDHLKSRRKENISRRSQNPGTCFAQLALMMRLLNFTQSHMND